MHRGHDHTQVHACVRSQGQKPLTFALLHHVSAQTCTYTCLRACVHTCASSLTRRCSPIHTVILFLHTRQHNARPFAQRIPPAPHRPGVQTHARGHKRTRTPKRTQAPLALPRTFDSFSAASSVCTSALRSSTCASSTVATPRTTTHTPAASALPCCCCCCCCCCCRLTFWHTGGAPSLEGWASGGGMGMGPPKAVLGVLRGSGRGPPGRGASSCEGGASSRGDVTSSHTSLNMPVGERGGMMGGGQASVHPVLLYLSVETHDPSSPLNSQVQQRLIHPVLLFLSAATHDPQRPRIGPDSPPGPPCAICACLAGPMRTPTHLAPCVSAWLARCARPPTLRHVCLPGWPHAYAHPPFAMCACLAGLMRTPTHLSPCVPAWLASCVRPPSLRHVCLPGWPHAYAHPPCAMCACLAGLMRTYAHPACAMCVCLACLMRMPTHLAPCVPAWLASCVRPPACACLCKCACQAPCACPSCDTALCVVPTHPPSHAPPLQPIVLPHQPGFTGVHTS